MILNTSKRATSSSVSFERLALQFFPESKGFISQETGLHWEAFLGAMMSADYNADHSCYAFRNSSDPDLGLASKGGLEGDDDEIYCRLIAHAGLAPEGRAVVVLDAIGREDFSMEDCPPFVCDSRMVQDRLKDIACFGQSRDTIFIFECGTALLVDHDDRVHWSRSRIRNPPSSG